MNRKLSILLIVSVLLLVGCTIPEVSPEPEPTLLICGGTYHGYYSEWGFCSCPNCTKYPRGAYYFNPDGEYMFLVGEPVTMPFITYGKCPSEYIEVYEIPEEYRSGR